MRDYDAKMGAYVRRYVGEKLNLPETSIVSFTFEAAEAKAWSEITVEDFSCLVRVMLADGRIETVWLDELGVVEFLNGWALS